MTQDEKPLFLRAFNRLAIALREHEPDTAALQVYFEALSSLEIEFVVAAVPSLLKGEWFPKTGEWYRAALGVKQDRIREQRNRMLASPRPWCPDCGDSGWRIDSIIRHGQPTTEAARCGCATRRYEEILGRVMMPALLPAPDDAPDPTMMMRIKAAIKPLVETKIIPRSFVTPEFIEAAKDDPVLAAELARRSHYDDGDEA